MESLEEKFKDVLIDFEKSSCTQFSKQCVEIAEDFAVGFMEFINNEVLLNEVYYDKTTKELLELYKQHLKTKNNG